MIINKKTYLSLQRKYKSLIIRLRCKFGFHNWINIDSNPLPNPDPGDMICWYELHKCCSCGKEEYKGMGCII
jgi:hypothetical protein